MLNVKELNGTMMDFQKQMMQMGMISEMIQEAMEVDEPNYDNESELNAIIFETEK